MKKTITEVSVYQGEAYATVSVNTTDGGSPESSGKYFYLRNGDRATITFYPDALPTDFENMMKRFKSVSNDKQADIKRGFESKRGTGKRGRR